ncbi:MAG: lipopolysaccharide biosynthesis protein [Ferrovibrionaceae bacterium]
MPRADPSGHLNADHLVDDIGRRSIRGGTVTLGAQLVKMVVQFATIVILARLLAPEAFGLIAMVAAINTLLDLVKEMGLSSATIQRPDITHDQVSALFWLNTGIGAALALALALAAPAIAWFYGVPDLVPTTRLLAIGFLLSGLTVQHWALLRRQMRFTAVAAIDAGAEVLGFATAIVMAIGGFDYWSLVAQRLVSPAVVMIGCWALCGWRPSRPRRAAGIGDLLRFGASVTGANLAVALTRSIDQVIIGRLWGPSMLGLYERALKLLMLPINNINAPIYAVAMPGLSRLATRDDRYRQLFADMMQWLAMLTMPLFAMVPVMADWVVLLLFGPRWSDGVPLVAWFGFAACYLPTMLSLGLLYLSQNRAGDMLRATLLDCALSIAGILAGLRFGVTGIAASFALTGLLVRTPLAFWLATRRGPVRLHDLHGAVLPSVVAALVAVAVVVLLRRYVIPVQVLPIVALCLGTGAGLAAALVTLAAIPSSRRSLMALRHLRQLRPREG